MLYLRQSTASQSVLIGPFVDTAGAAVTGLTIDAADIRLSKNGANIVGKNSGGGTHDELGMYTITLDATDTDTVGRLQLTVVESGALQVYHEFQVLEEATFDQLFAASALGYIANAPVNVAQISGDATAADNLETAFDDTAGAVPWHGIVDQGTMQAGSTSTTAVLRAAASFADDFLIGATIHIVSGTGAGQRRIVTDWVNATDTATVATWVTTPDNTSVYKVYATAPVDGVIPTASENATAVWAAGTRTLTALDEDSTTIDLNNTAIGSVVGAVGSVTGNVGGNVTGSVGSVTAIANNAITAAAIAADAGTEIAAAVLTAAASAPIAANVEQINTVPIVGDGSGTPFNV